MRTARVLKSIKSMTREELARDIIEKCEKDATYLMTIAEDVLSFYKYCGMTRDEASDLTTSILRVYNTLARYKFDILELEESFSQTS